MIMLLSVYHRYVEVFFCVKCVCIGQVRLQWYAYPTRYETVYRAISSIPNTTHKPYPSFPVSIDDRRVTTVLQHPNLPRHVDIRLLVPQVSDQGKEV